MIHVLSTCTVVIGKRAEFESAFKEVKSVFEKHGAKLVGLWWSVGGEGNESIWIHAWKDVNDYARARVWNNHMREIHGYSTPIEEFGSLSKKSLKIAKALINRTYYKGSLLYHQLIIKKFVESIVNGAEPPVTGEEGKAVLTIMDAIKNYIIHDGGFT